METEPLAKPYGLATPPTPVERKRNLWHVAAAISGICAAIFASYQAHGYNGDKRYLAMYDKGREYHMYYTVLLFLCSLARRPNVTGPLVIAGIVFFSGACYMGALTGNMMFAMSAPVGGICFMLAWLSLAL